jgi:ABC-type xylose transport system substrate-binding protein
VLKKISLTAVALLAAATLAACGDDSGGDSGSGSGNGADEKITLGFSQVGAESGWRTANTKSIQEAAAEAGIDLKFADAQQQQANQIKAIRSYIAQRVDVIAFSPVVESGWDTVLKEAKDADIPVILTDRAVDSQDTSLYKTFIGSDFVKEGVASGEWLVKEYEGKPGPVNIVELQGTTGSAPANDRKKGFGDVIAKDPKFKIIASQTGDFTRAQRRHGPGRGRGDRGRRSQAGHRHQDHHDRRGAGWHAGAGRWQVQLHRGVQPAARATADGPGEEGARRRVRAAAGGDRGDHLHPGAGEGSPAQPQVLTVRSKGLLRSGAVLAHA